MLRVALSCLALISVFGVSASASNELTPDEKKLVESAKQEFKKAEKDPPPSQAMQDKMQSGFSDPTPSPNPSPTQKPTKSKNQKSKKK